MSGAGPLKLAEAVQTVARILDGRPVTVIGIAGRATYVHESTGAVITVSVHLDSAADVDHVGDLFDLAVDLVPGRELHSRSGDWQGGLHVSLYGPALVVAGLAGVG
jgi:hypothetical protein